jgi:hypothetical protein
LPDKEEGVIKGNQDEGMHRGEILISTLILISSIYTFLLVR